MFELVDHAPQNAVIKVIGVGGGGGNAVEHMLTSEIEGVDFICANTDAQALQKLNDAQVLHIGNELTKGLGAGANPDIGREAAIEDRERIAEMLSGADMVFITAGMGGGDRNRSCTDRGRDRQRVRDLNRCGSDQAVSIRRPASDGCCQRRDQSAG